MTEKRFKLENGIKLGTHSGIWDSRKQHNQGIGDELWLGEVLDLLNENEELKQSNGAKIFNEIVYKNEINALKKENEELKQRIKELEKENEQLKHELLCKQLDKAPTEPINCKCYYKELQE